MGLHPVLTQRDVSKLEVKLPTARDIRHPITDLHLLGGNAPGEPILWRNVGKARIIPGHIRHGVVGIGDAKVVPAALVGDEVGKIGVAHAGRTKRIQVQFKRGLAEICRCQGGHGRAERVPGNDDLEVGVCRLLLPDRRQHLVLDAQKAFEEARVHEAVLAEREESIAVAGRRSAVYVVSRLAIVCVLGVVQVFDLLGRQ